MTARWAVRAATGLAAASWLRPEAETEGLTVLQTICLQNCLFRQPLRQKSKIFATSPYTGEAFDAQNEETFFSQKWFRNMQIYHVFTAWGGTSQAVPPFPIYEKFFNKNGWKYFPFSAPHGKLILTPKSFSDEGILL